MCTADLWTDLQAQTKSSFELIHIDLPIQNSPEEIVQALALRLPQQVALVGFSLGGYLAALYATTFPGRVKQLSIISNTPCPLNEDELNSRAQTLAFLKQFRYTGMTQNKAKSMLDPSHQTDTLIKRIIEMDAQLNGDILIQQLTSTTQRKDLADQLGTANIPVQFIASERDPLINWGWLQTIAENSENVKLIHVPGSGHMLPLEQPSFVAQKLEEFFC